MCFRKTWGILLLVRELEFSERNTYLGGVAV